MSVSKGPVSVHQQQQQYIPQQKAHRTYEDTQHLQQILWTNHHGSQGDNSVFLPHMRDSHDERAIMITPGASLVSECTPRPKRCSKFRRCRKPALPTHIHFGAGLRICRKKVERFLVYLLSACVVFFLCEFLKRFRTLRDAPLATDASVSFLMIFFLNDYISFPDDTAPEWESDCDEDTDDNRHSA